MPLTPQDRYWASQPAPVRALRNLTEEADRYTLAKQLANTGFIIDEAIMVGGWDPVSTMTVRANQGFTWVPSANQPNIPVMPGAVVPGLPSYDPNKFPTGSIKVTLDWPPAADMIATVKPFKWRHAPSPDPADPDGVGSTWNPEPFDKMETGAVYQEDSKRWEKVGKRSYYGFIIDWERVA